MKLRAISLQCFRGWKNLQRVELNTPITLVVGQNGRGKSSLLNAIEWCLFGGQVQVAGSGIQERMDWEVVFYATAADNEPTFVELEFEAEDGPIIIKRLGDQDEFTVTHSQTHVLTGEEAKLWLKGQGFPDWGTYKRAFCFHQEAARTRIVTRSERSLLIAKLIGLDELVEAQSYVRRYRGRRQLWATPDDATEEINAELERLITTAKTRETEVRAQLRQIDVDADEINDGYVLNLKNTMKNNAEELAAKLEIEIAIPCVQDSDDFKAWARNWRIRAFDDPPALRDLRTLTEQQVVLRVKINALEVLERKLQDAETEQKNEQRIRGDLNQLIEILSSSEIQQVAALDALEKNNHLLKILLDARQIITQAEVDTQCPVCKSSVPDLLLSLNQNISELEGPESRRLQAAVQQTTQAQTTAESNLETLQGLTDQLAEAKNDVEEEKDRLKEVLIEIVGEPRVEAANSILVLARMHLESLQNKINGLAAIVQDKNASIETHSTDTEKLILIEEWLSQVRRADEQIDLETLEEMKSFNLTKRQIADLKSDLEFLSAQMLDIQREQSVVRSNEVNAALGKYYSLILGVNAFVEIKVHQTAQNVTYKLVNRANREVIRILNQGAINALSLATMFAQTEAGLVEGGWSNIVLDDPIQSLDKENQIGLSMAIEELSKSWSVLVATNPGDFSTRIREYVDIPCTIYALGDWDEEQGARIE